MLHFVSKYAQDMVSKQSDDDANQKNEELKAMLEESKLHKKQFELGSI